MNAFKRYLRRKGVKLNTDYPCLPFYIKGKSCFEPGYLLIEDVTVNAEKAEYTQIYNVAVEVTKVNRDGSLLSVDDDNNPLF